MMSGLPPITLRAGPLALLFEPATASLRYLMLDGREALRRVYAAVRDHNWDTVEGSVTMLRQEVGADAFVLEFDAEHLRGDLRFGWHGTIDGSADGTIRFAFDGEARSSFRRNRIGFCVLHPAALAGTACRVEHVDGSVRDGSFPLLIAPHQPFKEVRAIRHEALPEQSIEVRMEGDTFETEDQRNWTDASFKTYCTPLGEPFPVQVEVGERVRQEVTVRLLPARLRPGRSGQASCVAPEPEKVHVVVGSDAVASVPAIGLGLEAGAGRYGPGVMARLSELKPAHLRLDLGLGATFDASRLQRKFERAAAAARAAGAGLEVALFLGDDAADRIDRVARTVALVDAPVLRWLVFHEGEKVTAARWPRLVRDRLELQAGASASAPILTGTDYYFTELNRQRPDGLSGAAGLCYSLNPQVHASDDASLMETLSAQATTLRSAASFAEGLPLTVSPITLRPRSNPNATESRAAEESASEARPDPRHDPRQALAFCAAWTLGSLKYISEGGAATVTYFEVTGGGGVMADEASEPVVYPVYHVLADLADASGRDVLRASSALPLAVEVLACELEGSTRAWLANLTAAARSVSLAFDPPAVGPVNLRTLDASTLAFATRDPRAFRAAEGDEVEPLEGTVRLTLEPWAVVRVDARRSAS